MNSVEQLTRITERRMLHIQIQEGAGTEDVRDEKAGFYKRRVDLAAEIEEPEESTGLEDEGEGELVGGESGIEHLEEEVEGGLGKRGGGVGADDVVEGETGEGVTGYGIEDGAGGGEAAVGGVEAEELGGEAGVRSDAESEEPGVDLGALPEGERVGAAVEGGGGGGG